MMEIKFNEQNVHDSVCEYIAYHEKNISPYEVSVELCTDDFEEFYARVEFGGYEKTIYTKELIEAIHLNLVDKHNFDRNMLKTEVTFAEGEGIIAFVKVERGLSLVK
ncbi:hypothetical protein A4U60_12115 [Priestia endophytica]|nr:hypothetical protein A4U60_12115 [Priestia endophytica]